MLLHPLGSLSVRQSVVPLNLDARHRPGRHRRRRAEPAASQVTQARARRPRQASTQPLRELFAPGQFFDMSDDDKLVAPSFESMDAGVTIGEAGYAIGHADRASRRSTTPTS